MGRKFLIFSRVAISLLFILAIWWSLKGNISELVLDLKTANKTLLIFAFFVLIFNLLPLALRLKLVFSMQKMNLTIKEAFHLTLIGFFFNSFLPTAVGGDIAKAHYASLKFNHKKVESYAAVFADRLLGFISIALLAQFSLLIVSENLLTYKVKFSIFTIFALSIFFIFFLLNEKWASKFNFLFILFKKIHLEVIAKKAYMVFNKFKNYKKLSILLILISTVGQLTTICVYFILSKSLGLRLPFPIFLLFIPAVMAASLIPSLGGTGPREGCLVILFSRLTPQAGAIALSVFWLVCLLALSIIGGIDYFLSGYRQVSVKEIEKEV